MAAVCAAVAAVCAELAVVEIDDKVDAKDVPFKVIAGVLTDVSTDKLPKILVVLFS